MFRTNDSIDTASREMRAMINEAEQLLKAAGAATGEKATELQKKGMDLLSCSISKAHELERKTLHSIKDVAASTDKLVAANPWRSVAVSGLLGAGIGLVLGIALARD
ncbi:DUF883 family protein [Massilia scottii]|uniref:DUF883 family protein n=1 Tax=Massilia scottii TaxID=3057166 RepID=UPI002796C697|nr:DUF883 domain-containing protein [Massilia sp. CCM 9029]MDQ1831626.1 DUF883 domain-containing protein [Massilia sp. CCM 9029]